MLLEAEGLTKSFGGLVAVKNQGLRIEKGEIVGLIGPNGAGKTTTFNLLSGLYYPDAGIIRFKGMDITRRPPHIRCRMGIGRTFQIIQPFENISVLQNVMVGAIFGGSGRWEKKPDVAAREICEMVGLGERCHCMPGELTAAGLKKMELARALATSPELLLLDEMMEGLTPVEAAEVVKIIRKVRDSGATVLLIEHVMKTVRDLSDRVVVMHQGETLAEGTYSEVVANPGVITAYLGEEAEGDAVGHS
ncbi:MAG: ABC transporter ATP-binding protein [Desulfocucumaceae bacterium]